MVSLQEHIPGVVGLASDDDVRELSDHDLMVLVAGGDRDAFGELYDRFSARALGLILGMLRNRAEAEDVLQETFWSVWKTAGKYDASLCAPIAWTLMIARSRTLDRLRKLRRDEGARSLDEADAGDEMSSGERGGAGRGDEGAEGLGGLGHEGAERLLSVLPEEQRRAVTLAFYKGLSREAIAAAEGVPVGTIKTRIRSGVRRMREHLESQAEAGAVHGEAGLGVRS